MAGIFERHHFSTINRQLTEYTLQECSGLVCIANSGLLFYLGVLKPGALMEFSFGQASSRFFFLGPTICKPQTHVLLEGFKVDDLRLGRISIRCLPSQELKWFTSHQLFRFLLAQSGNRKAFKMTVYDYAALEHTMWLVQPTASKVDEHMLSTMDKQKAPARNKKLPFGLKHQSKRRKTNNGASSKQKVQPPTKGMDISKFVSEMVEKTLPGESENISDAADLDSHSDDLETTSLTSLTSSSSSSESDLEEEVSAFPVQKQEEETTNKILLDIEEQRSLNPAASSAADHQGQRQRTQCQASVGVVDAGQQVSARLATCRYCTSKIQQRTCRVGYSFNVLKFHSWIHTGCFQSYIEQVNGDKKQAHDFLEGWLQRNPQSREVEEEFRTLISSLAER